MSKYDLKAMDYKPAFASCKPNCTSLSLIGAFYWAETPQGGDFWAAEENAKIDGKPLSKEAQTALKEMQEQWENENEN